MKTAIVQFLFVKVCKIKSFLLIVKKLSSIIISMAESANRKKEIYEELF